MFFAAKKTGKDQCCLSIEGKYAILIFDVNGQFAVFVGQQSKGIYDVVFIYSQNQSIMRTMVRKDTT